MDMRELKALEIAARCKIAFDGEVWSVPSQSGKGVYRVVLTNSGGTCTCDDFGLHGPLTPCNRILACRLVMQRECGAAGPDIQADAVPQRPTYKQNWPLYNVSQQTEKHRFQELLFDLTRNLEDPPQKTGRKRTSM